MSFVNVPADPLDRVRTTSLGPTVHATQGTTRLPGSAPFPSSLWGHVEELYRIDDGASQDPATRFRTLGHILVLTTHDPSETEDYTSVTVALTEDVCLGLIEVATAALRDMRAPAP